MKKLTIFTVLLIFLGTAYAQAQEPVVTWDGLIKQKEKSDADILNAKKNTKVCLLQVTVFKMLNI